MKRKLVNVLLVLPLIAFLLVDNANATHIAGGNMYYTCLGNDMYEITFQMRRDCHHGADDAPHTSPYILLSVFTRDGQFCPRRGDNGYVKLHLISVDTLNTDPDDFCIQSGEEVCISLATYRGIACLPANKDGHILAYQRCCRNETLLNIENPLETGGTWLVDITGQAMMECNSNPVFNAWPPVYICQNDDLVFDHSANDPNGDSLAYSLCTPLKGASISKPAPSRATNPPYDSIVWLTPFNRDDMMGGTPLRIDPKTGIITATPDQKGQYLIGVMVREYRQGQLIGYVKRDFEFNVVGCGDKPDADFEVLTDKCDGLTQTFNNLSTGHNKSTWYFDHPRTSPSSMEEDPSHTYDTTGSYKVVLIVENDQGCLDSAFQIIDVLDPQLHPDFRLDVDCNDSLKLTLTDLSSSNYTIVEWKWEVGFSGGTLTSTDQNPMFVLHSGGNITISLTITDEFGCDSTKTIMEEVNLIDIDFISDTLQICQGDSTHLIQNGNPNWEYIWDPGTGLKLNQPHDPIACPDTSTLYCVSVSDDRCTQNGCIYVMVKDTVPLVVMGEDSTCNGRIDLMAIAQDTSAVIEWYDDPGLNNKIGQGTKLSTTINQSTVFYAVVNKEDMCPSIVSHRVVLFDAVIEDIDRNPILCFGPGMINLNPNGNPDYTYQWSPGFYLDDSTTHDPKATIDSTTLFEVIIINPEYPQCPDTISVLVTVAEDFDVKVPIDTIFCVFDSVKIIPNSTKGGLTYTWCGENGKIIGRDSVLCFDPRGLDTVKLVVADIYDCEKTFYIPFTAYFLDASLIGPDTICAEDTVMIMLINQDTSQSIIIRWDPEEEIIGTAEGTVIKVAPSGTTTYTATVEDKNGCLWELTHTVYVIGFVDGVIASADPGKLLPGESTQLDVNAMAINYMWTGEGLDADDIKSPTATPPGMGQYVYKVKVTDEDGCMGMDTVHVNVTAPDCIEGVFVPNAFSPNNDGHNDILYVRSNYILSMEFRVYNRWGELMFVSNSISNGWDGTYNGTPLPPDVYGYQLEYTCVDNMDYKKKGNVSLIR